MSIIKLALTVYNLKIPKDRREDLCVGLIKNMLQPTHRLHSLLPGKFGDIKEREIRANSQKIYIFFCKTERFKYSSLVFAIDKYNNNFK